MNVRDTHLPEMQPAFTGAAFQQAAPELRQGDKVCLFLIHENSLLFVVRYHPKDASVSIEPAGGKIDPKADGGCETVEEALVREGHEEYGVTVSPNAMLGIEDHPFTRKPVGYFACHVVDGIPYNAADKEHLGIIKIPVNLAPDFDKMKEISVGAAGEMVNLTIPHIPLSRPIEFRVPEKLVMRFIQQIQDEPGAAFLTREPAQP